MSDREKRAIYDQYGEEGLRNGVPDGEGGVRGGFDASCDAGQIFESFFGTANPFADFGFGNKRIVDIRNSITDILLPHQVIRCHLVHPCVRVDPSRPLLYRYQD